MKPFGYAVLIGRFQPFHLGHRALFSHARDIAEHVILIVGSHNAPTSIRNPWNTEERTNLIRAALTEVDPLTYSLVPISDSAYNFNDWIIRVQQAVYGLAGDSKVAIVGHFKDDTSFYLNFFPDWELISLPSQERGISSTEIRRACFEDRLEQIRPLVTEAEYGVLVEWARSNHFARLRDEYQFIQNYRKKWEGAPVAPTFVTADAVVLALGHVLLIRRKVNPGKGCYALPGGFVKTCEGIETACLRELKEETAIEVGSKELRGSIKMSHVFDHPLRDPRGRVITHAFMFELTVKDLPTIKAGNGADQVLWLPLFRLEESESRFFNDHAQIIKFFVNRMN